MPDATIQVDHFLGTPLSGPTAGAVPTIDPTDALSVRVTYIALERPPKPVFEPLGTRARLLSDMNSSNPLLANAHLLKRVQLLSSNTPEMAIAKLQAAGCGRIARMGTNTAALPAGVTADFLAFETLGINDPITARPITRRVELELSRVRAATTLQLAIVVEDVPKSPGVPSDDNSTLNERAILDLPAKELGCLCVVLPFRFDEAESKGLAIILESSSGTKDAAHQDDVARCEADLRRSIEDASKRPSGTAGFPEEWSSLRSALSSLSDAGSRRVALVFLADQTGALLCEELAMIADDDLLEQLSSDIQSTFAANLLPRSNQAVGWILDHEALQQLDQLLNQPNSDGKPKLSDEQAALLTTYTGEVGRHGSSLEGVLKGVENHQDLENRLLAENLIYLEDSSPASRVRAFDWLKARGHAPVGYDPLGTARDRRNALEQNLAAASAPVAPGPAGGMP